MSSIKVAVRVRPFNRRELELESECCVSMSGPTTTIFRQSRDNPLQENKHQTKSFSFDHSYWSFNKNDSHFSSQEKVYHEMGLEMLDHALQGYNVCIIAYGQTGAGKSYTMMGGSGEDMGLIPRFCNDLFVKLPPKSDTITYTVEVSYMEIYMEKVRDLLNPEKNRTLRVKSHPSLGNYVEDLTKLVVNSFSDINDCIELGNKSRTTATTRMNDTSSRSHAIFNIILTQKEYDASAEDWMDKVSKVSLVDLAGSERAESTQAEGLRLKEGSNINTSLFILSKVISALAKKEKSNFVPYRESVLTTLLKENLGGNSKTAMISAISPAVINFEETLNTLKYANQTKKIHCKAVINENAAAKRLRELREENALLRSLLEEQNVDLSKLNLLLTGVGTVDLSKLRRSSDNKSQQGRALATIIETKATNMLVDSAIMTDRIYEETKELHENESYNNSHHNDYDKHANIEKLKQSEKLLQELEETYEEKLKRTAAIKLKLTEREKVLALKSYKKWKSYRYNKLRDEIWKENKNLIYAKRVAEHMDKLISLKFILTKDTVYSSPDIYEVDSELDADCKTSKVQVEVNDTKKGLMSLWSLKKLHQRIELMQDENVRRDLKNCDDIDTACRNDPFYDRHPFCTIIGRSYLYLSSLLHSLRIVQRIPIINEKADVKGYLRVAIKAVRTDDFLNSEVNLEHFLQNRNSTYVDFLDEDMKLKKIERTIDNELDDLVHYKTYPTLRKERYPPNCYTNNDGRIIFDQFTYQATNIPTEFFNDTNCDSFSGEIVNNDNDDEKKLSLDSLFTFKITVLEAIDLPRSYTDVFCQYSFLHQRNLIFSTKPVKNTRPPSGFFSEQKIIVKVTNAFLNYLKYHPLVFEVFGQNQSHPSLKETNEFNLLKTFEGHDNISPRSKKEIPRRLYSNTFTSTPLKPTLFSHPGSLKPSSHVQARFDILIWLEICELTANSDTYTPVIVDRSDLEPARAAYLLHQGIQRKICLTIVHEGESKLQFNKVKEILVGKVRNNLDPANYDNSTVSSTNQDILSLAVISDDYLKKPIDGRMLYRIEANWDTSMHNTTLLNRLTSQNERIYLTVTAYIDLVGCAQSVVFSKDIAVMVVKRESESSKIFSYANRGTNELISFFSGTPHRNNSCNHMSSIYELVLLRASDSGSPRRFQSKLKSLSSKSTYNLQSSCITSSKSIASLSSYSTCSTALQQSMQPIQENNILKSNEHMEICGGNSQHYLDFWACEKIIDEHQWVLEKTFRLNEVEKTRHILLVRDKLKHKPVNLHPHLHPNESFDHSHQSLTQRTRVQNSVVRSNSLFNLISQRMSRSSSFASLAAVGQNENQQPAVWFMTLEERNICMKYLNLFVYKIPTQMHPSRSSSSMQKEDIEDEEDDFSSLDASKNLTQNDTGLGESLFEYLNSRLNSVEVSQPTQVHNYYQLIPEMEEVRLSPLVSKRGYLNYMESREQLWFRRWFVVVRPYLIVFSNSRELLERDLINLTTTQIELPEAELNIGHVFTLTTKTDRVYMMHTENAKDLHDWIYALNPLLAGQVKSKQNALKKDDDV